MSKHGKSYNEPETSMATDALEQDEILNAAAQRRADEGVMEALAAEASMATVIQEPPPDDYHALLSLLRSLDGPQRLIRSAGYSRPSYPPSSDYRTGSSDAQL
jgi:hypothetical protein